MRSSSPGHEPEERCGLKPRREFVSNAWIDDIIHEWYISQWGFRDTTFACNAHLLAQCILLHWEDVFFLNIKVVTSNTHMVFFGFKLYHLCHLYVWMNLTENGLMRRFGMVKGLTNSSICSLLLPCTILQQFCFF